MIAVCEHQLFDNCAVNPGCPGQYESCFSPEDEQESEGAIYSAVRHRRHVDGSEQADGVTARRSRDRRSQRAPVPAPRSRRNTKYSTLRACHSAGLTQAEFMERSRYARDPERYIVLILFVLVYLLCV